MKLALFLAPLATLALVAPGSAAASLPDFQSDRITARAIGGVKLGMSLRQAKAAWGGGSRDDGGEPCGPASNRGAPWRCTWKKTSRIKAWVTIGSGGVEAIGIAGPRRSRPGRLRTANGWGLGTKGETLFMSGCSSSPSGLGAPVQGVGAVYTCKGVRFYVSSTTGRTVAVSVG